MPRFLVLLLLVAVPAQSRTISGWVVDIHGGPLPTTVVSYSVKGELQSGSMNLVGNYLLPFGTSGVPEDPLPPV
jgi:hypothetical protein